MTDAAHRTAQLGELVVAAFDEAAKHRGDPSGVSMLATQAVARILRAQPELARRLCAAERTMHPTHLTTRTGAAE